MLIKQSLVVMTGGALGALLRWRLSSFNLASQLPWGTLAANLIGCFTVGLVLGATRPGSLAHLFLVAGLCGAMTTFSTFIVEVLQVKPSAVAVGYAGGSLLSGLILVWSGFRLARFVSG